jgi:hypothetical protein
MRVAIIAALILLAASCTSTPGGPELAAGSRSATVSASAPESPSPASPSVFVRTCEMSVFGRLGRGWRQFSILAGPLALVGAKGYSDDPARVFADPKGRWSGQKVLVRITGSSPVTVEIDPKARSYAGLVYDPDTFNTHNPERAQFAVRFEPCSTQTATQFNGAFLVDGVRCVPVTVAVEGDASHARVLEFGPCTA